MPYSNPDIYKTEGYKQSKKAAGEDFYKDRDIIEKTSILLKTNGYRGFNLYRCNQQGILFASYYSDPKGGKESPWPIVSVRISSGSVELKKEVDRFYDRKKDREEARKYGGSEKLANTFDKIEDEYG